MASERNGNVLSNIHNLVTWREGQNYMLNGCMQYLMECLGMDEAYDYWFFSGVTGDNFVQVHGPHHDEFYHCLSHVIFDREFARNIFDACGYEVDYIDRAEINADRPAAVEKVVESIDAGVPVISKSREGSKEFTAICGYEDDGESLLILEGDNTEPTRYDASGHIAADFIFAGEKKETPPLAEVYREAVMDIPSLLNRPPMDGITFGEQAFTDWADSFLDGRFDEVPADELKTWNVHGSYLCIAATNGGCREFLTRAAELNPDMDFIDELDAIYVRQDELFKNIEAMGAGFDLSPAKLTDREFMGRVSETIREFETCCDEVLDVFSALD